MYYQVFKLKDQNSNRPSGYYSDRKINAPRS